jgi:hypothetical protein
MLFQHLDGLSQLLDKPGQSNLSLRGLVQPERLGIEVTGEASNNQIEALNANRVEVLSGNTVHQKFSLLGDLNIHIHVTRIPPHEQVATDANQHVFIIVKPDQTDGAQP